MTERVEGMKEAGDEAATGRCQNMARRGQQRVLSILDSPILDFFASDDLEITTLKLVLLLAVTRRWVWQWGWVA